MDVLQDARHRTHRRGLPHQSGGRSFCGSRAADQPHPGRRHSVFPTGTSADPAGSAQAAAEVQAAAAGPQQLCRHRLSAQAMHPPQCAVVLQAEGDILPDQHQKSPQLRVCRARWGRASQGRQSAQLRCAAVSARYSRQQENLPILHRGCRRDRHGGGLRSTD